VAANGRNGPVRSDSSGFERKLVRWCRIRAVVSDWYVRFSVRFSDWKSSRAGSHRPNANPHLNCSNPILKLAERGRYFKPHVSSTLFDQTDERRCQTSL
jgi:hypothetical protein